MKVTKQTIKQIIKEELRQALAEEEEAAATSKTALANFFKQKYEYLMGSESSNIKLQTSEIRVMADMVDTILGAAAGQGNATRDLMIALDKIKNSSAGKEAAPQPAPEQGQPEVV